MRTRPLPPFGQPNLGETASIQTEMPHALEICIACDDESSGVANALAAAKGGANRLECCAHMDVGGLTPALGVIQAICEHVPDHVEVLVMIRPRGGDFEWTEKELTEMMGSIKATAACGAHGVVSGALSGESIDAPACESLIDLAGAHGLAFTFHRAVDAVSDRQEAVRRAIEMGAQRILTAGTAWESGSGALEGLTSLRALHDGLFNELQASAELVVGGGVSQATLPELRDAFAAHQDVSFHAYSSVLTDGLTDPEKVRELKKILSV